MPSFFGGSNFIKSDISHSKTVQSFATVPKSILLTSFLQNLLIWYEIPLIYMIVESY